MAKAAQPGGGRLVGGRYALEALIGRGGMGEVWRARHVALKTLVAIKFLHGAAEPSERAKRRFLTEAQVTANLRTRHAVQVFDFGVSDDGRPYLVMELLEGETLDKRIARKGRLPLATTSLFLGKAARALDRAHALGIVHRDFKPENVMLVADEEDGGEVVKVVDFGIAKLVGDLDTTLKGALGHLAQLRRAVPVGDPPCPPLEAVVTEAPSGGGPAPLGRGAARTARDLDSFTTGGVGTPHYMAPEQVQDSAQVGPAADIWAFGVVAYECVTGRRPFDDASIGKVLARVLAATPPAPASSIAPVPALFDDWFRVACAASPRDRFPDVQTAAAALAFALEGGRASPSAKGGDAAPSREPSPMPQGDVAPTLSSRRECAEAAAHAAQPRDASPSIRVSAPAVEIVAASMLTSPGVDLSPLASTLEPSLRMVEDPPSAEATPLPGATIQAARLAPVRARMVSAAVGLAVASAAILFALRDEARLPPAVQPVVKGPAPLATSIAVAAMRSSPAPVLEPAVAAKAASPEEAPRTEPAEAWSGSAGKRSEPPAPPSAAPPRAQLRRRPSEATPSAYRLPPLGI